MKRLIVIAAFGLGLAACSHQDSSTSASAPGDAGATDTTASRTTRNELGGPSTGVGAAVTASSGTGTATASGAAANESAADRAKSNGEVRRGMNTGTPPAGTGGQNPTVNSNDVGNAKSSTPQNNGSTR